MTVSTRVAEFDTWRPGYGQATVIVYVAGTNTPADIFADEALTQPLSNPITLAERILGDISYGRFSQPVYVGVPYELQINSIDRTGVTRPAITALDLLDASKTVVTVDGGATAVSLDDHLARRIDVRDYGDFRAVGDVLASTATNTATLTSAIGVAATRGGGFVEVPGGTYQISQITLPQGVVLRGAGRGATILQSNFAGNVVTIGGVRAGLNKITIDGITLVGLSVGLYAENKDQIVLEDAEIKRFETGIYRKGGMLCAWHSLFVSNCGTGYKAYGDTAAGVGGAIQQNEWTGGKVELCSVVGIDLKNVDTQCAHNTFRFIFFDSNTADAIKITGARTTAFINCSWNNNTSNLNVIDATPATALNTVIGLELTSGSINAGTITLNGNLESTVFRRLDLTTVAITLTTPLHNILAEDCREISAVTIAGTATAWVRHKTGDRGNSSGITTGNAPTKTWSIALKSGQQVYLEGKVVARQRNGIGTGFYHIAVSAGRPGATLNYDTQTANFAAGNVVTGQTSGATARITADADSGTFGALTVQDIVGVFVDNEIITDAGGGSALANGAIVESNAALVGTVASIRAAQETDATWDATFTANGPEIQLNVTGATGKTIEWTTDVDVVSS